MLSFQSCLCPSLLPSESEIEWKQTKPQLKLATTGCPASFIFNKLVLMGEEENTFLKQMQDNTIIGPTLIYEAKQLKRSAKILVLKVYCSNVISIFIIDVIENIF